jgi:hypothetical protein
MGPNFCQMHSNLLALVGMIEFQTARAYYNFDLTNVKYNT